MFDTSQKERQKFGWVDKLTKQTNMSTARNSFSLAITSQLWGAQRTQLSKLRITSKSDLAKRKQALPNNN